MTSENSFSVKTKAGKPAEEKAAEKKITEEGAKETTAAEEVRTTKETTAAKEKKRTEERSLRKTKSEGSPRMTPEARQILKAQRMPAIVTFLMFFIYHVIGAMITFTNQQADYTSNVAAGNLTGTAHADYMEAVTENLFGFARSSWNVGTVVTFVAAALLALYGYRWLLDRRMVDFYESQPVSRRKRFFSISAADFAVFAASYAVTMLLGLLIAAFFGGMSGETFLSAILQFLNCLVLYAASYAVAVLAVMLTGTVVTSLLAAAVMYCYEMALTIVVRSFFSLSFATYSARGFFTGGLWCTPLYNASERDGTGVVRNLIFGAVIYALAYFAYTKRPNEAAGTAVVFRPVREAVKVAISVLAGMSVGLLFSENKGTGIFVTILAALLVGCIMEWIYAGDYHRALRHMPSTLIGIGISALVVLGFTFDIFGYDRWIPSENAVESASVFMLDDSRSVFRDDGSYTSPETFVQTYMKLTDIEAVEELARDCIDGQNESSGNEVRITYRMKNGSERERVYHLPTHVDAALMDRIMGSEEYKEGSSQIYHDDFVSSTGDLLYIYNNGHDAEAGRADYKALHDAYVKDLGKVNYTYLTEHNVVGTLEVQNEDDGDEAFIDIVYTVYEGFDNTIEFLKNAGIYLDVPGAPDVSLITVSSGQAESGWALDEETGATEELSSQTAAYSGADEIEEIMKNLVNTDLAGNNPVSVPTDTDIQVIVTFKDGGEAQTYSFRSGKVPEFVKKDLGL